MDLLRLPVPAAGPEAIGMLVYVGPADPSGVERLRASLSPSTFLLWLYPPDSGFSPMPERPLEGTRTLTCPLAEGAFYSDRVGLLIAMIPERRVELRVAFELETRCVKQISRIKTAIRAALENHSNQFDPRLDSLALLAAKSARHLRPGAAESRGAFRRVVPPLSVAQAPRCRAKWTFCAASRSV